MKFPSSVVDPCDGACCSQLRDWRPLRTTAVSHRRALPKSVPSVEVSLIEAHPKLVRPISGQESPLAGESFDFGRALCRTAVRTRTAGLRDTMLQRSSSLGTTACPRAQGEPPVRGIHDRHSEPVRGHGRLSSALERDGVVTSFSGEKLNVCFGFRQTGGIVREFPFSETGHPALRSERAGATHASPLQAGHAASSSQALRASERAAHS